MSTDSYLRLSFTAIIGGGIAALVIVSQLATAPAMPLLHFGDTNLSTGLGWTQHVAGVESVVWTVEESDVIPPAWQVKTSLAATITNEAAVFYHFRLPLAQSFYRVGVRRS